MSSNYFQPAKKILYIDLDGVLADFESALYEKFPHIKDMPSSYDPDTTPTNGIADDSHKSSKALEIDRAISEEYRNIFRELKPVEGAVEAFKLLCRHYEVFILSTPMWNLPESYTDKRLWVEEHLGENAKKRLILSHNKGLLKGDYLIDDRRKNGVEQFKGVHLHFGQGFADWEAVIDYLSEVDNWLLNPDFLIFFSQRNVGNNPDLNKYHVNCDWDFFVEGNKYLYESMYRPSFAGWELSPTITENKYFLIAKFDSPVEDGLNKFVVGYITTEGEGNVSKQLRIEIN